MLAILAANRAAKFTVVESSDERLVSLAAAAGRTATQTRREVRKLELLGVLEEVERRRKTEVFALTKSKVTKRALALTDALVDQLGPYRR